MPVFEGALERSVDLAAAMDSRGYGRTAASTPRQRRTTALLLLGGLVGVLLGTYAALDSAAPSWLALGLAAAGVVAAVVGLRLSGRRAVRTRYRPDPWALPEWLVSASGVAAAVGMAAAVAVAGSAEAAGLAPSVVPPAWPSLPLLPTVAVLLAVLPAWLAPPVPLPRRSGR
jgi:energy-coupling factor transport system permease protein